LNTPANCHPCALLAEDIDERNISDIKLVQSIAAQMLDAYDGPCSW
jgi:hypothetical protein